MNASKVWQTQDGIKSSGVNGTRKKQGRPRNRSEGTHGMAERGAERRQKMDKE